MPTDMDDLLAKIGNTTQAMDITQVDRLKVAICGNPKTGKSRVIAATARKPVFVYDFDDRKESIAGSDGVTIKTLIDIKDDEPIVWPILEADMEVFKYFKAQGKLPFKSMAFDSMTFMRKCAEHQFMKDSTGSSRFKVKVGQTNYIIPKDWDAVTGVQKLLESLLSRAFALDVDVYATFHLRPEKDQQKSTKTEFVYKDNLIVDPPNLKMLLPKFNDTWRTFVNGNGEYKLQLKPDFLFEAATVLKNVEKEEDSNITELLRKHNGNK